LLLQFIFNFLGFLVKLALLLDPLAFDIVGEPLIILELDDLDEQIDPCALKVATLKPWQALEIAIVKLEKVQPYLGYLLTVKLFLELVLGKA
jgi:hypothetical protein